MKKLIETDIVSHVVYNDSVESIKEISKDNLKGIITIKSQNKLNNNFYFSQILLADIIYKKSGGDKTIDDYSDSECDVMLETVKTNIIKFLIISNDSYMKLSDMLLSFPE